MPTMNASTRYRGCMEIGGLPLHPLVVHAAVVFVPLAVLAVIGFAGWQRHRWLTRWPAVILVVVATGSVWVSRLSGNALLESRPELERIIQTHQDRGTLLSILVIVLLLLTLAGAWSLGGPSALASGRGAKASRVPMLDTVLPTVLVIFALVVLASAVLTGDSGSRAVWG